MHKLVFSVCIGHGAFAHTTGIGVISPFLGYNLSKLYMHCTDILEIVIQTQHLDLLWVKLHQSNEIVGVASFCGQHLRHLSEMLNTS